MLLSEILNLRGLGLSRIKLVRNTVNREYIKRLIDSGNFDLYQSVQKTNIFKDTSFIISFTDLQGTKALLYGVFQINGVQKIYDLPDEISIIKEPEGWKEGPYYKYDMERIYPLQDLEERLVINWGTATISWHQRILEKEVIEILPKGFIKPFPRYQNVVLSFAELEKMVNNPDSNRQWKTMLSNVYGVYLILDKKEGQQYVGSAYGKEGIWGRWSSYVQSKHGNNKILITLLDEDRDRYKYFQFSVLSVLPNSSLHKEVIELETVIKEKLGSKAFGLNAN